MHVRGIPGEPMRFFVSGDSGDDYLVDLESHFPLGECACRDYQCRRLPAFRTTKNPVRCKHLVAAREWFTNHVIRANSAILK